jgi:hypothetical protein
VPGIEPKLVYPAKTSSNLPKIVCVALPSHLGVTLLSSPEQTKPDGVCIPFGLHVIC